MFKSILTKIVLSWGMISALAMTSSADGQANSSLRIEVGPRVRISQPDGGWHNWYDLAVDPEDPNKMMVCGSRWVAKENALYGFVYSSIDGGRSWRMALEDKNSPWVSEHSCAYGANGRAYFVSEASKVIDGLAHHDQGTTRIYVSDDSGRTWREAIKTGWMDWTASVVDTRQGPNQNRLYTFFNYANFNAPDPRKDRSINGNRIGLFTFREGDKKPAAPIINALMGALKHDGSFPDKAIILRDGSLISIFWGGLKTEGGFERITGAVRTSIDRKELSPPRIIGTSKIAIGNYCLGNAIAYDSTRNRIFVAYNTLVEDKCRLVLTTSDDNGDTWSEQYRITPAPFGDGVYKSPALAIGRDGTLGLMWREGLFSDCWYFAASKDDGRNFTRGELLSACTPGSIPPVSESSAYLMTTGIISNIDLDKKSTAPWNNYLGLRVLNSKNRALRNANSLLSTPDGLFHAIWIENGEGEGRLLTATVGVESLKEAGATSSAMPGFGVPAVREVTKNVAILYGGDQGFDKANGTFTVSIRIRNNGTESLTGALLLRSDSLDGKLGKIEIVNSKNGLTGAGAIWDLSQTLPSGVLRPGETTKPFSLVFRYMPDEKAPPEEAILIAMHLKAFSGTGNGNAATTQSFQAK